MVALVFVRVKITPNAFTIGSEYEARVLNLVATNELDAALMFRDKREVPAGVKPLDIDLQQNLIVDYSFSRGKRRSPVSGFAAYLASTPPRTILTTNGYLP